MVETYFDFINSKESFSDSDKLKARMMLEKHHIKNDLQTFFNKYKQNCSDCGNACCLEIFLKFCDIYNFEKELFVLSETVDRHYDSYDELYRDFYLISIISKHEIVIFKTYDKDDFLKTIVDYKDKIKFKCMPNLGDYYPSATKYESEFLFDELEKFING